MTRENKFGAKASYYDGYYFASKLEKNAYEALKEAFPRYAIIPQYKIRIKPPTDFYPAIFWKSDFGVIDDRENLIAIYEAKGQITRDFKLLMKFLEYFDPVSFKKIRLIISRYSDRKSLKAYKALGIPFLNLDEEIKKNLILSLNPNFQKKIKIVNPRSKKRNK